MLSQYLNLGKQPLANALQESPKENPELFELEVKFCKHCSHSQLGLAVPAEKLYKDYKYVSGTTETLKEHFKGLREALRKTFWQRDRVLDIGCNDGTLLDIMRHRFPNIAGVDPAENLRQFTEEKKIPVIVDYWNSNTAWKLEQHYKIITACNVFAHQRDPKDFLLGCSRVIDEKGVVVIEFPYNQSVIDQTQFDQFYHEHINYFTAKSMAILAESAGFRVANVSKYKIHGGSIRFVLDRGRHGHSGVLRQLIATEAAAGLHDLETYNKFTQRVKKHIQDLATELLQLQLEGYTIVGYGASAKSSTLFNSSFKQYFKGEIPFIVDNNPLKQGLYCPGSNTPIMAPDILPNWNGKIAFLILSWNFMPEILERIRALRPNHGDIAITYVPEVRKLKI